MYKIKIHLKPPHPPLLGLYEPAGAAAAHTPLLSVSQTLSLSKIY